MQNLDKKSGVFCADLQHLTHTNEKFRNVIYTGNTCQIALMAIGPGKKIPLEAHTGADQFFRLESGEIAINVYNGGAKPTKTYKLTPGGIVVIPSGVRHEVINIGADDAHLYTIYAGRPQH